MKAALPELSARGLVLWQVRRPPTHGAWCYVSQFGGRLALVIHDTAGGTVPRAERFDDVPAVVRRSEQLRRQFLSNGWQDVELPEDRRGQRTV